MSEKITIANWDRQARESLGATVARSGAHSGPEQRKELGCAGPVSGCMCGKLGGERARI